MLHDLIQIHLPERPAEGARPASPLVTLLPDKLPFGKAQIASAMLLLLAVLPLALVADLALVLARTGARALVLALDRAEVALVCDLVVAERDLINNRTHQHKQDINAYTINLSMIRTRWLVISATIWLFGPFLNSNPVLYARASRLAMLSF